MVLIALLGLLLAVQLIWLSRSGQRKWIAYFAAAHVLVFLFFTVVWLVSDYFTGAGFGSSVIYHLRVGVSGAGFSEYRGVALFALISLALTLAVSWWLARYLSGKASGQNSGLARASLLILPVLCLLHPTVNGLLVAFNAQLYGPGSIVTALFSPGADEQADFHRYFVRPDSRGITPNGKNLVFIYAESLEQTYFDKNLFPGLMTELRELGQQAIRFTDIHQTAGTDFTIGGMVGSQCGLPLITEGHPNSMRGMTEFLPAAVCLSDVLKTHGYTSHYMGGARTKFAGKSNFLETHQFDSISGLEELKPLLPDPAYVHSWGLYDDFLLDRFYERFVELSGAGSPFALFGLTLDTHQPSGHVSASCGDLPYGDGSNRMLNAVKCADHLVARLIRRIRESPWVDDTILVVASDHLAFRNDAYDLLLQGERRNLLWMFPGEPHASLVVEKTGSSMDTAATILGFLGSDRQTFGLGKNLLGNGPTLVQAFPETNWQLHYWRDELGSFWQLPARIESIGIRAENLAIDIDGRAFQAPALLQIDRGALTSIRFDFDTFAEASLGAYVSESDPERFMAWIDECQHIRAIAEDLPNTGYCLFAGKLGAEKALFSTLDEDVFLDAAELQRLADFPSEQSVYERRVSGFAKAKKSISAD